MFDFKGIAAMTSAFGLLTVQPASTLVSVDPRELHGSKTAFTSTFSGVDADGETLVWSSDAASAKPRFLMRIVPMSSAASAAESVWPVSATLITRDGSGTPMESRVYGIIDWSRQELRLHGTCATGSEAGSSVTATGTFSHLDVAGTVEVLPLTASR